MFAAFGLASIGSPLPAQLRRASGLRRLGAWSVRQAQGAGGLAGLSARRQRQGGDPDRPGRIVKDAELIDARINGANMADSGDQAGRRQAGRRAGRRSVHDQLPGQERASATAIATVGPVFVGDLWVLAGQSNMEGVGDLIDVTPPHPRVMLLGMDGKWEQAEEPLHWLVDSPDPVHSGDPKTRAERSAQEHKTRTKGAGLGLPFAVAMVESTGVPIGLVACAHGGTSMEQWNPAKKEQGGNSLYGSMLRQVKLAGGKVKGVLWYQGESDANGGRLRRSIPKVFSDFIAAVRSDFGQPELPFYYVQIGRFVARGRSQGLERRAGRPARARGARAQHGRRLGDRPGAGRRHPRRHAGPEAGRPAAGPDRRARAVRPGRGDHADLRPRHQGPAQHAGRQVQGGQHGRAATPGWPGRPMMGGGGHDDGPPMMGMGAMALEPRRNQRHRARSPSGTSPASRSARKTGQRFP